MNFLVVPDSFKGSMTGEEFCAIARKVLCQNENNLVASCPIADGGEGSVECLMNAIDGVLVGGKAADGNLFKKNATYGVKDDSAYIAIANTSGLPQTVIKNPLYTSTYGMGEQIKQALNLGKKNIYLFLGGSSTNDCGAGMLAALGCKFFDENGEQFIPVGGTLGKIASIDDAEMRKSIEGVRFTALCDVKNPLLGKNGCSYVFAPQKGAKGDDLSTLEENMRLFYEKTKYLRVDQNFDGAGAAGGTGYCIKAFLGGNIVSGIDYFLDACGFDDAAKDADFIISGEGKFDRTSLNGKAVGGIVARARKLGKEVVVFCGVSDIEGELPCGVKSIYRINDASLSVEENMKATKNNFEKAISKFLREVENA